MAVVANLAFAAVVTVIPTVDKSVEEYQEVTNLIKSEDKTNFEIRNEENYD